MRTFWRCLPKSTALGLLAFVLLGWVAGEELFWVSWGAALGALSVGLELGINLAHVSEAEVYYEGKAEGRAAAKEIRRRFQVVINDLSAYVEGCGSFERDMEPIETRDFQIDALRALVCTVIEQHDIEIDTVAGAVDAGDPNV